MSLGPFTRIAIHKYNLVHTCKGSSIAMASSLQTMMPASTATARPREAAHARACRSRTALTGGSLRPHLRTAQIRRGPVSTVSSNLLGGPSPAKYLLVQSYPSDNGAPTNGEARIKVIGVGGGGGNALNRMIEADLQARWRGGLRPGRARPCNCIIAACSLLPCVPAGVQPGQCQALRGCLAV